MQGRQGPDRRPMSRANQLMILVSLVLIFGFGALSIYSSMQNQPAQPTATPAMPPMPTDQQAGFDTIDEALSRITPTPTQAPVVLASPPPTAEPDFFQTPAPTDLPTLKKNSTGSEVRALQERLIELGYMREGSNDGQFGRGTENAVKAFQNANGLRADGAAGPKTLQVLYSNDAKPKP